MARLLVVDDEALIRKLLSRWLLAAGHEVEEADGAQAALDIMSVRPASVVFCDVHMPGRDGLWLTKELREHYPHVAVILATGVANVPPQVSMQSGVLAYLIKPFRGPAVSDALAVALKWTEESVLYETSKEDRVALFEQWLESIERQESASSEKPLPELATRRV